jgi:hypothetical protein
VYTRKQIKRAKAAYDWRSWTKTQIIRSIMKRQMLSSSNLAVDHHIMEGEFKLKWRVKA